MQQSTQYTTVPTAPATHLVFVRHGQSLYNRDGEKAGPDSGLTELGWQQSLAVAKWLVRHYQPDAILCSSLVRSRQTAEVIAQRFGLLVQVHEGIEETEHPYWSELPRSAGEPLKAWHNQWQPQADTAPHYTSFRSRLYESLQRLLSQHAGQTVIIVSHGGAIGSILRSLFGGHHVAVFTENAGVTHLTWDQDHWRLVCHNNTAHLDGLQPAAATSPSEPTPTPTYSSPWADGHQFAAIAAQFSRVAAAPNVLDARAQPAEEAARQALVKLAAPEPHDRVLDVATGIGAVAFAFAPHVSRVLAIDLSPAMLERAEATRANRGIHNVHFRLGEISSLSLAPSSFDIITCQDLLHYVTDPTALFVRLHGLLAPDGKLALDTPIGSDDPVKRATQNAIERRRDPALTQVRSAAEIERAVVEAGFIVQRAEHYTVVRELDAWLGQAAADEATRSAVSAMLEAGLEADAAGMAPRRTRDKQIVFAQSRLRLLAATQPAPKAA